MKKLKVVKKKIWLASLGALLFIIFPILPSHLFAAVRTWDGGGTDGTCGGAAGDGNKWSCAANWSGDTTPTSSDSVVFDGTSTKNATIDSSFQGTIIGMTISSGYTGVITQARTLTINGNYSQATGTFTGGSQTIDINGSWALSGGVFTATSGTMTITTDFTVTNSPTFSANGGTITFDGGGGSASTLSCGNVIFNAVAISKSSTSFSGVTVGSNCTLPLGNSPSTTSGRITNNGTINIGTGTWTHTGGYSQTTGTLTFTGTTIDMNNSGDSFFMFPSFTLSGGTFTAASLTTLRVEGSLDNTGNLLPNNIALTLDGGGGATGTITCGTVTWGSVAISKSSTSFTAMTFSSSCVIPLGNSPTTTAGKITNNGSITVGTGTWTHNGGYQQNTGSSFTMTGTNIDINDAGDSFFMYTSFTLSGGTFTASNLTTINVNGDLDNTGSLLPNGLALIVDGDPGANTTLTCGTVTWGSVAINKNTVNSNNVTIGSSCVIPLGNSPTTTSSLITNNGTINIGTGTWTHNGGYTQTTGTLTFTGTTINMNNYSAYGTNNFTLAGGTFTAASLTTFYVDASLTNSGSLLPNGVALIIDGAAGSSSTITCGTVTWGSVAISKLDSNSSVTIGSTCVIPLGNSPTTSSGLITNNGTINIGTGTWTHNNGGYSQTTGTLTFTGTTIEMNNSSAYGTNNFTLAGGTFTAASLTTLNVETSLTNSGNLLPNGITLTLDGGAGATGTINCGTAAFGSITVAKISDTSSESTFSSNCTSTGNFTRTRGIINNSGSARTVFVGGNFSMSTTGAFGGSNLTVELNGTGAQTIAQNAANTFSSPFVINKSLGTATLTTNLTSASTLTVTQGTFSQGATFNLTTGGAVTIGASGTWTNTGTGDVVLGGNVSNAGTITLDGSGAGCGGADAIALSDVGVTQRTWSGAGTFTLQDLDVSDMAGSMTAVSSTNTTNNSWTFVASCNTGPNVPSSLGPVGYVGGSWGNDNTPTLTFTLSDPDVADTVQFTIQIDDTSDFSSVVVQYTSALAAQGGATFTVGQVAGGGSYTTGSAGQTLSDSAGYYWRVKAIDSTAAESSYSTANSGAVAFKIDTAAPTAGTLSVSALTTSSITVQVAGASDTLSGLAASPYNFANNTAATSSGAQAGTTWLSGSLSVNNEYTFQVTTTDLAGNSATSATFNAYTAANPPANLVLTVDSPTQITADWEVNSNPAGTEFFAENTTASTDSGWIADAVSWISNGLDPDTSYTFSIKARNGDGVETSAITDNTGTDSNNPDAPSSLGPAGYVNSSWGNDNTPTLTFNLSDPDGGDTVKFKIQIDDTSNFSSVVVDYTSALGAQGSFSFNVGQVAGGGSYTTGSAGQTLSDSAGYYWRVKAIDDSDTESAYTAANSGLVAFKIDTANPTAGTLSTSASTTTSIIVQVSGAADALSGLAATAYNFANTTAATSSGAQAGTSWSSDNLSADTNYTFQVTTTDLAGNYATSATFNASTAEESSSGSSGSTRNPPPTPEPEPVPEPEPTPTPEPIPTPTPTPTPTPVPTPLPSPTPTPPPSPDEDDEGNNEDSGDDSDTSDDPSDDDTTSGDSEDDDPISFTEGSTNDTPSTSENNFVTKAAGSIAKFPRAIVENKVVEKIAEAALTVPVVLSSLLVSIPILAGISISNYLLYLLTTLAQFLGMKKKPKPWGTVYDSRTKRPIPFARVEILNDQSRKLESTITDREGRYGFLVPAGAMELKAYQDNYVFPSQSLPSSSDNILYSNIYKGGFFNTLEGGNNFDLPMDPINPISVKSFYPNITSAKVNDIFSRAADIMFALGAGFGILDVIMNPSTTNFIILGVIILVFALRKSGFKLKPFGTTKDSSSGQPLPFSLIALHDKTGERVNFTVSDDKGRYFLLAPSGRYLLKAYTPSHIIPMRQKQLGINAKRGWVSREIGV